jgi:ribosomal-protein-alanine N-acetyltransferase
MEITIREMLEKDLPQVAALEAKSFTIPWSERTFADSLASDDTLYYTVWSGDTLAGYCGCLRSFDEADITNVAVDEAFRNQGIGYQMLRTLMETGHQLGITRYTLEVRVSNAPAIHLYEKLGFSSAGVRPGFYDAPKEDALIMWT